jgi:GAF domain-containing protein
MHARPFFPELLPLGTRNLPLARFLFTTRIGNNIICIEEMVFMTGKEDNGTNMPDRVVRIELISYFNLYPETVATSEEMASRLNRNHCQVERQMKDLVELGILEQRSCGERTLYIYLAPMSLNLIQRKGLNHTFEVGKAVFPVGQRGVDREREKRERDEEKDTEDGDEEETAIRMRLMIATLKKDDWRDCLELLLDTLYRTQGSPCAVYHLGDGCSEMFWESQRGAGDVRVGMTRVENVQNMVVEVELIREKGFLETAHYLKYLYPLTEDEDILVCISRNGGYHGDMHFLQSLMVDTMPVVAEKRRLHAVEEITAEKVLQNSIYWNALHIADMRKDLLGTLASVAKSVNADRASLLVEDGSGSLRTLSTYGLCEQAAGESHPFAIGEGVAGWCAKSGNTANLADARIDPRFIHNQYNDIDSMLCCPLIPTQGEVIGALCAVNKRQERNPQKARFDGKDVRLVEGIARVLANAFTARDSGTKILPRQMINDALAAQPL